MGVVTLKNVWTRGGAVWCVNFLVLKRNGWRNALAEDVFRTKEKRGDGFRTRRAKDDEEWCETHLFNVRSYGIYLLWESCKWQRLCGKLWRSSAGDEFSTTRRTRSCGDLSEIIFFGVNASSYGGGWRFPFASLLELFVSRFCIWTLLDRAQALKDFNGVLCHSTLLSPSWFLRLSSDAAASIASGVRASRSCICFTRRICGAPWRGTWTTHFRLAYFPPVLSFIPSVVCVCLT